MDQSEVITDTRKSLYAHELSDEQVEAIRNAKPSEEAEELNYLMRV
jgi:hypothetical protein